MLYKEDVVTMVRQDSGVVRSDAGGWLARTFDKIRSSTKDDTASGRKHSYTDK